MGNDNLLSEVPLPQRGGGGGEEDEETRYEWDFNLTAVVQSTASGGAATDAIGVVEFDQEDNLLATGGIARKIRIYAVSKIVKLASESWSDDAAVLEHGAACEYYMYTPAKLSSLRWKPGTGSRVIGAGDYDGVVTEYDLEKHVSTFERDEHGGRRVLSIDYGSDAVGASGSDDGTMQIWDSRCDSGTTVASVRPDPFFGNSVCSVEFNPFEEHLVAVGCADRKIYGYDLRIMAEPVFVLTGHEKAVTYAKFLDSKTIISSATDGCLKMWRPEDQRRLIRTYKGHSNSRRFVGLSIWRNGGLLCCGSENNHVFVYDNKWSNPIWVYGFGSATSPRSTVSFIGGVCWRQSSQGRCTMVAGSSDGVLQVYQGVKRP